MFEFEDSPWLAFRLGYVFHILILSCFSLFDLLKIIWISPFSIGNLVNLTFILVVTALIAMLLDIFKYYLDGFHGKYGANRETVCRRDQIIGFGGVLMCGMATHLVVYHCKDYKQLVTITFYVSAFSILSFKKFFLETPVYYVKSVKYGNPKTLLITFCVIYFLLLIVFLKTGVLVFNARNTNLLFFGITGSTATIELLMVLLESFEMRTEQESAQIIEKLKKPVEIPPLSENEMDQSFNDVFMYAYSILAVVILVFTILAGPASTMYFTILTCLSVPWFNKQVNKNLIERKDGMDEFEFFTARLRFGFEGIVISWLFLQYSLYSASFRLGEMISAIFPSLAVSLTSYYQFIHGYRDTCNLNYNKFRSFIIKTVLILIFIGMIVIRISISSENRFQNFQMGCIQFIMFFMPLGALPEFLVVLRGGLYLEGVEEPAPQEPQQAIQAIPEIRKVTPEIKCQTCQKKYSEEFRIPRILKECGHTVCEPCADQLLQENRGSFLYCPVCRMATVVMGTASLLKKNWAALEMMEDN